MSWAFVEMLWRFLREGRHEALPVYSCTHVLETPAPKFWREYLEFELDEFRRGVGAISSPSRYRTKKGLEMLSTNSH